jgi:uncharacterized protein (DUF433 family)
MARGKKRVSSQRPISARLSSRAFETLERRRLETGASRNSLIERYVAEGVSMDEHPDIYFRDGVLGRRAALIGTRLDVWQVIATVRHSRNSIPAAAEYLGVPAAKIQAAVSYYATHREEVDEIAAREAAASERAEAAWRAGQAILSN